MGNVIAFFISPHGFGHAARSCSVMQALAKIKPDIQFLIVTTVPRWFFDDSLDIPFTYVPLLTDIGLVQADPLKEDLEETVRHLDCFFPLSKQLVADAAAILTRETCELVVADISPLGIASSQAAGLPSVLIENFTWDWIYQDYAARIAGFNPHVSYLKTLFSQTTYRILARPYCEEKDADLITHPISRSPKVGRRQTRSLLGIDDAHPLAIVSMGGIENRYDRLENLFKVPEILFLIPGSQAGFEKINNVIKLPHRSTFYHPDLIEACDAVVGKIGYSTLAETFHIGKPFGYIPRREFRESTILEEFINSNLNAVRISEEEYRSGSWVSKLDILLRMPCIERSKESGAEQAASFIVSKLPAV